MKLPASAFLAAAAFAALPAFAQPRPAPGHDRPPQAAHAAPHVRTWKGPVLLDDRYHHDHYYPAVGFTMTTLPVGAVSVAWRDGTWFFHGGVWFRPSGPRYVVAAPPAGVVVPFLPPTYVTLWIGGAPYYYANGVYYASAPSGYTVVAPPTGAQQAVPSYLPPTLVLYPRNGQSPAQVDADRAACNQWAGAQPGVMGDADLFYRGFGACMDGKGYSVR